MAAESNWTREDYRNLLGRHQNMIVANNRRNKAHYPSSAYQSLGYEEMGTQWGRQTNAKTREKWNAVQFNQKVLRMRRAALIDGGLQ